MTDDFKIITQLGKYNSRWVVIRNHDGKVMTEDSSVKVCLRWVKYWGPDKL